MDSSKTSNIILDSDDEEMDDIIAEFAEEEGKEQVIQFSDSDDEIGNLIEEFASEKSEDEIDDLIEEFASEINNIDVQMESTSGECSVATANDVTIGDRDCTVIRDKNNENKNIYSDKVSGENSFKDTKESCDNIKSSSRNGNFSSSSETDLSKITPDNYATGNETCVDKKNNPPILILKCESLSSPNMSYSRSELSSLTNHSFNNVSRQSIPNKSPNENLLEEFECNKTKNSVSSVCNKEVPKNSSTENNGVLDLANDTADNRECIKICDKDKNIYAISSLEILEENSSSKESDSIDICVIDGSPLTINDLSKPSHNMASNNISVTAVPEAKSFCCIETLKTTSNGVTEVTITPKKLNSEENIATENNQNLVGEGVILLENSTCANSEILEENSSSKESDSIDICVVDGSSLSINDLSKPSHNMASNNISVTAVPESKSFCCIDTLKTTSNGVAEVTITPEKLNSEENTATENNQHLVGEGVILLKNSTCSNSEILEENSSSKESDSIDICVVDGSSLTINDLSKPSHNMASNNISVTAVPEAKSFCCIDTLKTTSNGVAEVTITPEKLNSEENTATENNQNLVGEGVILLENSTCANSEDDRTDDVIDLSEGESHSKCVENLQSNDTKLIAQEPNGVVNKDSSVAIAKLNCLKTVTEKCVVNTENKTNNDTSEDVLVQNSDVNFSTSQIITSPVLCESSDISSNGVVNKDSSVAIAKLNCLKTVAEKCVVNTENETNNDTSEDVLVQNSDVNFSTLQITTSPVLCESSDISSNGVVNKDSSVAITKLNCLKTVTEKCVVNTANETNNDTSEDVLVQNSDVNFSTSQIITSPVLCESSDISSVVKFIDNSNRVNEKSIISSNIKDTEKNLMSRMAEKIYSEESFLEHREKLIVEIQSIISTAYDSSLKKDNINSIYEREVMDNLDFSGNVDERTSTSRKSSISSDERDLSKMTQEGTNETEEQANETEEQTKETEEQTRETEEQTKEIKEQTNETEEQTKEIEEQANKIEMQTNETEEQINETEEQTNETEEQTNETEEQTNEIQEKTNETEERTNEIEVRSNEIADEGSSDIYVPHQQESSVINENIQASASEVVKSDMTKNSETNVIDSIEVLEKGISERNKRLLEISENELSCKRLKIDTKNSEANVTDSKEVLEKGISERNKRVLKISENELSCKRLKIDVSNVIDISNESSLVLPEDFDSMKHTNKEELVYEVIDLDIEPVDKINEQIPWNPHCKIETTRKTLDRIALNVSEEFVKKYFETEYSQMKDGARQLEELVENFTDVLQNVIKMFKDFRSSQKILFADNGYKKVTYRTVGTNVKITTKESNEQKLTAEKTPGMMSDQKQQDGSPTITILNVSGNISNQKQEKVSPVISIPKVSEIVSDLNQEDVSPILTIPTASRIVSDLKQDVSPILTIPTASKIISDQKQDVSSILTVSKASEVISNQKQQKVSPVTTIPKASSSIFGQNKKNDSHINKSFLKHSGIIFGQNRKNVSHCKAILKPWGIVSDQNQENVPHIKSIPKVSEIDLPKNSSSSSINLSSSHGGASKITPFMPTPLPYVMEGDRLVPYIEPSKPSSKPLVMPPTIPVTTVATNIEPSKSLSPSKPLVMPLSTAVPYVEPSKPLSKPLVMPLTIPVTTVTTNIEPSKSLSPSKPLVMPLSTAVTAVSNCQIRKQHEQKGAMPNGLLHPLNSMRKLLQNVQSSSAPRQATLPPQSNSVQNMTYHQNQGNIRRVMLVPAQARQFFQRNPTGVNLNSSANSIAIASAISHNPHGSSIGIVNHPQKDSQSPLYYQVPRYNHPMPVHQISRMPWQGLSVTMTHSSNVMPRQGLSVTMTHSSNVMPQLPNLAHCHPTYVHTKASPVISRPLSLHYNSASVNQHHPMSYQTLSVSSHNNPLQLKHPPASSSGLNSLPVPRKPYLPLGLNSSENGRNLLPIPIVKGSVKDDGSVVISWDLPSLEQQSNIALYQLYSCQEKHPPESPPVWKSVGDIASLELPVACTLNHFEENTYYYFTVRVVDKLKNYGPFSEPVTIYYSEKNYASPKI